MLKGWRAYKALSSEQRQMIDTKQVKLHAPIDEAISSLKGIADMDKYMTWSATGVGCTMALAAIAAIFLTPVLYSFMQPLGILWLVICALFFLVPLIVYRTTRKIDVSDNLRLSALPMLYVFRDDIDPMEPVDLELDLRQPMCKEKFVREAKPRERLTEKYYSDPWMSANVILVDGSRLRWSVTDTLRHRSVTKRTSRGKYKTKTKESKKCDIDAEVTVRNKAYEVQGGDVEGKKTTLTASKTIKIGDTKPTDPKVIIEVIASLFQRVQPAK
jgi:hypothetical protein